MIRFWIGTRQISKSDFVTPYGRLSSSDIEPDLWEQPGPIYFAAKRATDLLGSIILLVPFSFLSLLVICFIRVFDGEEAIYKQRRKGAGGNVFVIYKFRTMSSTRTLTEDDEFRTYDNDPRITPIGKLLRKFRLDELPQIINVIKGEMSWVGPRPEPEDLALHYENVLPKYKLRYLVPPGVSGWAQIRQGHVTSDDEASEKLEYDLFYVKNASLGFDIRIAIETIKVVFLGRGSK